jgi:hypothetical protein
MRCLFAFAALALVACGESSPPKVPSPLGSQFACQAPPAAAAADKAALPDRQPPKTERRTEEADAAMKEFERERWKTSIPLLERVAHGETKDDQGNQQIAEFYLGIALWHMKRYDESIAIFVKIAGDRNHTKNESAFVHLVRAAGQYPERVNLDWFANFDETDVVRFDTPDQHALFWRAAFLVGARFYRDGQIDRAEALFARVAGDANDEGGLVGEAKHCMEQISVAKTAAWKAKREEKEKAAHPQ